MRQNKLKFSISRKPKPADLIIFALPIIIAVSVFFAVGMNNTDAKTAEITVNGKAVKTVDLSVGQTIDLGLEYGNIITVRDGKIGISHTDCPGKTCEKSGYISRSGQSIVCVPSKLIITVRGGSDKDDCDKIDVFSK